MEASFLKRLGAYFLDMIILGFIVGLVLNFLPKNDNDEVLKEQLTDLSEKLVEPNTDRNAIMHQYGEIVYEQRYNNLLVTIINFAGTIGYFIVFQFKNNGQTLGKKLFKIKVIKKTGDKADLNDILLRSLLVNEVIYSMLVMSFIFIFKGYNYFVFASILGIIQLLAFIISMFMIIYRKDRRGLHDLMGNTKVVIE